MSNSSRTGSMAWPLVLLLAGVGGAGYAGLTISGWINGWERPVALAILAAFGLVIGRGGVPKPVLHGFVVGFLGALLAIELQAAFLPTYFANNPEYAVVEIPFGLPARVATALLAPFPATFAGLVAGGIVWILGALGIRGAPTDHG